MALSTNAKTTSRLDQVSSTTADLETEVERKLHFSQHAGLRHITYRIDGGTVVLHGRVPSYYLKQLAQVKVTCIPGIELVDNRIEVAVN
ncbi:MAG: BON domain-containing protein [Planctomycetaceae bacterium]|nr:BON domain-containing protein [Planctomycetales bacterium]MCB9873331.1 BON domain-containing protein [Planctomycetaceae bacterium]